MKRLPILIVVAAALVVPCGLALGQNDAKPSPTPSATPLPEPTAVPMADVVTQAGAAEATLQEMQASLTPELRVAPVGRGLPALTKDINARLAETTLLLKPGVLLETLRELEARWEKIRQKLSLWERELTARANAIDKHLALVPDLRATWTKTLEAAQATETPPEIRQQIESVLGVVAQSDAALQKQRSANLTEQSRMAEQSKRVAGALASVRAAQTAAVSRLFERDSSPIWTLEVRQHTAYDLVQGSQASFGAQFAQLRTYVASLWTQFIFLALLFGALAAAFFWVKHRASKWTDEDAALERANRVLQLPIATAAVLTLLVCGPLFEEPPRLFWAILATVALVPIVLILRRLIDRHLFPIVNALVVFYVIAQFRQLAASLPELSRLILLLEMVGGAVFLVWFIHSTRLTANATTSRKMTRASARLGLVLFGAVFLATAFGYFRLANYLAAGSLAAAYLAIFLYAAAGVVSGLIFFALEIRPLATLKVVRLHRALLGRRLTRFVFFLALLTWIALTLDAFLLRVPLIDWLRSVLTAEMRFRSLHVSLGAVLAFALTIWLAALLSRLIRFLLEEDIYNRFRLSTGSSYAVSTLLHYVVLLIGFFVAIAALGVDMTKFTVLAGAFGVGIGFGLQNIVNNFVSGLILLFEQPVKVGDVVQVDTDVGVIRRIGIRASIIRLFDSSELIVPNGKLISEKVTNFTLSNRQRRIEIRVGVAYGTDPKRVIELLTKVAATHPLAAKYPAPQTLMIEFGTDSLNFDVRLWTDDYDQWVQIKSDVVVAITEALAEAKIAIPFPQRDLHLQSVDPSVAEALRGRRDTA